MERTVETVTLFGSLLLTLVALFIPITIGIALAQRWIGPERLERWLGGRNLPLALAKGTVLGAVTPFCGCSTVPLLLGLLKANVRFAAVAAFMLASPLLNPYILGVVALLFGGRTTVVYAAVAAATSMGLGAVWELAGLDRHLAAHVRPAPVLVAAAARTAGRAVDPPPGPDLGSGSGCDGGTSGGCSASVPGSGSDGVAGRSWSGWRAEVAEARRAAIALLRPMLLPMLLGVTIGAVLYGVVPEGWLADLLGASRWWSLPLAAVLGLPLYLRGEAAFPIGAGLLAAGVGEGPMFAMVIAGMGASLPEVTILSGIFRPRLLAAFLASVFAMAILGGAVIPAWT